MNELNGPGGRLNRFGKTTTQFVDPYVDLVIFYETSNRDILAMFYIEYRG